MSSYRVVDLLVLEFSGIWDVKLFGYVFRGLYNDINCIGYANYAITSFESIEIVVYQRDVTLLPLLDGTHI